MRLTQPQTSEEVYCDFWRWCRSTVYPSHVASSLCESAPRIAKRAIRPRNQAPPGRHGGDSARDPVGRDMPETGPMPRLVTDRASTRVKTHGPPRRFQPTTSGGQLRPDGAL
jgi:hypothetical protein